MAIKLRTWRVALLAGCAAAALGTALPAAASAEGPAREYAIGSQDLGTALRAFAMTSGHDVVFDPALVRGRTTAGVKGAVSDEAALRTLLEGTELAFEQTASGGFVVRAPRFRAADAEADGGTVEALIVTAQKREEDIQDVPIAISAFSQEDLTRSQIAGGPDLITQVPNMTFTKTNFSSYSIQIRGIGTQAVSATTDAAVAVAFNNTPFIRNRFFEQEFYDLQRVEVLRGPQGTLYGRNATAGVVNIISAKPKFRYEAKASADLANYGSTRVEGMVNIPLAEDAVALRLAGAWTKRDGFVTNLADGAALDGRDLWSTRASLRFSPSSALDMNLIWEHFEEDDDRLRSGKQLCKKHVVTEVGPFPVDYLEQWPGSQSGGTWGGVQATLSQGCERASLYSPESFQKPNGLSVPFYGPLGAVGLQTALTDPYLSGDQSPDLRVIESGREPSYRAKADLAELQVSLDVADGLTLTSETAYSRDFVFSTQDFGRFLTAPGAWSAPNSPGGGGSLNDRAGLLQPGPNGYVFCDPQLGCYDRLMVVDLSTADYRQFSQEFRLGSDFDGPFNFSLGANFLRFDGEDKYYVFINSLTLSAANVRPITPGNPVPAYVPGVSDNRECLTEGFLEGDPTQSYSYKCAYIDPNPIDSLNDKGHNYFLSKNPYRLISYAVFGEAYYNISDNLKVTAGLRWTVDKKNAPRIPSWTLAGRSWGYPVREVIDQEWREPTGRLAVDWKPELSFTDETLVYASYAHGYKAGGANPPPFVALGQDAGTYGAIPASETRPKAFAPEFVDAFELGSKNTLADGRLTLNLAAFYYDYKDYQISEIVDRSAFNRNFDATVWGLEVEADWRPLENLRLSFKGGYENTSIADGESAVDLMDRTAGVDGWVVVRPFPTFASSCILPEYLFYYDGPENRPGVGNSPLSGVGNVGGGGGGGCEVAYLAGLDPLPTAPYVPNPVGSDPDGAGPFGPWSYYDNGSGAYYPNYPGFDPSTAPNNGEGFSKDLSGNALPNAPEFTATISADYTLPLPNDWLVNLHTDLYWQAESWWRVFDDHEYNKLDEYFTMNLAAIFTNDEAGWTVMAYVKNVFDRDSITGAFLNSDDTGLTTNVFLTEPRLYGLRVTKKWTGGPLLGSFGERSEGPYMFTLEMSGQAQRHDAPNGLVRPTFAGAFSPGLDIFGDEQNQDLDIGDGRQVKLTYRPGGPWSMSAGYRIGDANSDVGNLRAEEETDPECVTGGPLAFLCLLDPAYSLTRTNWSNAVASNKEENWIADFSVGYDVGFGSLSRSTLALGLRHAELKSRTVTRADGVPDWDLLPGGPPLFTMWSRTRYEGDFQADRTFEGAGPTLSWDASHSLLGDEHSGRLELDWTVTGGVMFGKQDTSITGEELSSVYLITGAQVANTSAVQWTTPVVTNRPPVAIQRSEDTTVPVVDLSLGLSYRLDRMSIGAGYRWERYFDAIDGGMNEHQDYDRTIDGPYFKLSVGFGGG